MTEYDVVEGSLGDFAVSMIFTVAALATTYLYIWPIMVRVYMRMAVRTYEAMVKCVRNTRGEDSPVYINAINKEMN